VDVVVAVAMRVRVLLGDPPVGGPARVGEADRGLVATRRDRDRAIAAVRRGEDRRAQVREVADRAHGLDVPVFEQGDAGRVIAPIFEFLETCDQKIATRPPADVSDDSTHDWLGRIAGATAAPRTQ
jgi:hypothetical protein